MDAIATFCEYQIALCSSGKINGMNIIATFCEYQTALVAVGKTTEWVQLALFVNIKSRLYLWGNEEICETGAFCEYQIAFVAVGNEKIIMRTWRVFVNIKSRMQLWEKTRKRLKIVHFTTIIALVAVGKQGKEQIVGLHREGKQ